MQSHQSIHSQKHGKIFTIIITIIIIPIIIIIIIIIIIVVVIVITENSHEKVVIYNCHCSRQYCPCVFIQEKNKGPGWELSGGIVLERLSSLDTVASKT